MAHEPEPDPDEQQRLDLEELIPGRDALLREIGRSLREASPAWADVLLREAELLLRPGQMTGMHRDNTQCEAECGVSFVVRRDGDRLPPRTDGPGLITELKRTLEITHPERKDEIVGQLLMLSTMPISDDDVPPPPPEPVVEPGPDVESIEPYEYTRCPACGARARVLSQFYCPPCGMG